MTNTYVYQESLINNVDSTLCDDEKVYFGHLHQNPADLNLPSFQNRAYTFEKAIHMLLSLGQITDVSVAEQTSFNNNKTRLSCGKAHSRPS